MNAYLLREKAETWLRDDIDPACQDELRSILDDHRDDELQMRFAEPLTFGTAGLRGITGAGPNRMNRAVVVRTTWGLARFLLESRTDATARGVVIGYDGRIHSRVFAEDAAAVLMANGIRVFLFSEVAPTPLTAFAVTHANAVAGIVITASHNPREYNGYKLYTDTGAQIVPPADVALATHMQRAPAARSIARLSLDDGRTKGLLTPLGLEMEDAYIAALRTLRVHTGEARNVPIVYTAMHGVGDRLACRALRDAGFTEVISVPEQARPDGTFPTVRFPNPEEEGALDLAIALARRTHANLILANDPDADRLAVAIPSARRPGDFDRLTGNQIGILLGHYLLTERPERPPGFVLASCVSSPMLGKIACALGAHYEETLTGFKWIAHRAIALERERNETFLFGYEEALGYAVGTMVRDKDGISAAVLFAEMAMVLKARGETIYDGLTAIYRRYGLYASSQVSVTRTGLTGTAVIRDAMIRLRAATLREVGGMNVLAIRDFAGQTRRVVETGEETVLPFPPSDVLSYDLDHGHRVIVRPSGTEPKIKFYFDVCEPIRDGEPMLAVEKRANATLKSLANAFIALAAIPD